MDRVEFSLWLEALDQHPEVEEIDFMIGYAIAQGQQELQYQCPDSGEVKTVPDSQWHKSVALLMRLGFITSVLHVPVDDSQPDEARDGVFGEHVIEFNVPNTAR